VLDDVKAAPIDNLPVDDRWITVPTEVGDVRVRLVRPQDAAGGLVPPAVTERAWAARRR
jgi:acetyl esterase